jgi:hypothetical protein
MVAISPTLSSDLDLMVCVKLWLDPVSSAGPLFAA